MAASLLSQDPGKVAAKAPPRKSALTGAAARKLPELSNTDLDKLFDQARRLEPETPEKHEK